MSVRLVARLLPLAASVAATAVLARLVPRPDGLGPAITWWVCIALAATVVLLVSTYGEEAGPSLVAESGAAAYVTKAAFGPDRLEAVWSGS